MDRKTVSKEIEKAEFTAAFLTGMLQFGMYEFTYTVELGCRAVELCLRHGIEFRSQALPDGKIRYRVYKEI